MFSPQTRRALRQSGSLPPCKASFSAACFILRRTRMYNDNPAHTTAPEPVAKIRNHHIIRTMIYDTKTTPDAVCWCSFVSHLPLYFIGGVRQCAGKIDQLTAGIHIEHILDSHTQPLFWNVDARLDREHHSGTSWDVIIAFVVNVEPHIVTEPVNEISS